MLKKLIIVNKKNKGFTIIELLISIFILSIGIASYNFLQLSGLNYTYNAYKEEIAIQNLNDYTDYLKHVYAETKQETEKSNIKSVIENQNLWNQNDACSVLISENNYDCRTERNYEDIQLCSLSNKINYQLMSLQCENQKMINTSKTKLEACSTGTENNYCIYTYWNNEESTVSYEDCKSFSINCVFMEFKL